MDKEEKEVVMKEKEGEHKEEEEMRKEGVKTGVSSSSQKEASLFIMMHRDPESSNDSVLMSSP